MHFWLFFVSFSWFSQERCLVEDYGFFCAAFSVPRRLIWVIKNNNTKKKNQIFTIRGDHYSQKVTRSGIKVIFFQNTKKNEGEKWNKKMVVSSQVVLSDTVCHAWEKIFSVGSILILELTSGSAVLLCIVTDSTRIARHRHVACSNVTLAWTQPK